jgi:hypothetical protein
MASLVIVSTSVMVLGASQDLEAEVAVSFDPIVVPLTRAVRASGSEIVIEPDQANGLGPDEEAPTQYTTALWSAPP